MLLKRSSTTQQNPLINTSLLTLPLQNRRSSKILRLLSHFWKGPFGMMRPLCYQSYRADSGNGNGPWVEQILLLLPNVLRGAECQEQGRRAVFPQEARCVRHQSDTGKGTWCSLQDTCAGVAATSWVSLGCSGISPWSSLWTHPAPADRPGSGGLVPSPSN